MRRRLLLLAVAVAALTAPVNAVAALPTGDVRVIRNVVPLPTNVQGVGTESCLWTRDARAILCPFVIAGEGMQVGTIMPDGSGFRCITCGRGLDGRPGYLHAFADGKRFFFGSLPIGGNADAGANVTPHVGECEPSLLECAQLAIREVALPAVTGALNTREPRVSLDGRHLVWTIVRNDGFLMLMADLERRGDGYAATETRVLNAAPAPQTAAEWAVRGSFNEAKAFDGSAGLVFASTRDGGMNLEDYALDLRTGETRRLTHNLEWDEDLQLDPTGTYGILGSARRMHNQVRAAALAGAPPFLDAAITAAVATASLGTHEMRLHNLEKWLITPAEERAGGDGVMLNDKTGGWASGASKAPWSPDGTKAVWGERGPDGATRLVVVRFPQLERRDPPACLQPDDDPACQTPTPTWAPLLSEYLPLVPGIYTVRGPRGGTASIVFGGTVLGPLNRVQYDGYTAEDGRVIDGVVELLGTSRGGLTQTIKADLSISGSHTGASTSRITGRGTLVCGTVETVLDGVRLRTQVGQWNPGCRFRTPEMCPNGADADATETGECSQDGLPNRYLAREWGQPRCSPVRVALPRTDRPIVRATATRAGRVVARTRGRRIRAIRVRPLPGRRSTLRITLTLAGGESLRITRRVRGCPVTPGPASVR